jgi:uncharacterized protein YhaN
MRIARLSLGRYGHLADVDLLFPRAPGLHVVLGANEAGKSTALAAIGDALFRFPTRTPYAFTHATRDLRLGIELHAQDGRIGRFVRRKGSKDDLSDETGAPLPESAIAAFLAGASRERFQHVFGLDAAALRHGGQAILEGKGEVGESILQAHTGLHGFRALAEKLGEEAGKLFGDRRGRRELHAATDRFKEAKTALEERSVEPASYKADREEQDRLTAARDADGREAEALHLERARLDRIRRTHAPRLHAARLREERAALGDVAALPGDAEAKLRAAAAARDHAARDLEGRRGRDGELAAALADLPLDTALLDEGEAIDLLAADRSRIASAERDREEQHIVAGQRERAVLQAAQRLGLRGEAAETAARIPDALARDAAQRAIDAHGRLAERRNTASEHLADARILHEAALAALAALPEPAPAEDLRAAIERVRGEGRIDAEHDAARQAWENAQAELARALAALPQWRGTAEALAAAPIPLPAMIEQTGAAWERAAQLCEERARKLAEQEAAAETLAADLQRRAEAGELPTADAIAALREPRDRAWRLLRRHRIEGGAAPAAAELAGLGDAASLPDRFEGLMRDADALADRAAAEARRVEGYEQCRRDFLRTQAAREVASDALKEAETARQVAHQAWSALWQEAGVAPLAPPAMREWLRQRESVLATRTRTEEAFARYAAVAARHESAKAALAALRPGAREDTDAKTVATLLAAAERECAARERAGDAQLQARKNVATALAAVEKAERADRKVADDLAAWGQVWDAAAAGLGLPPGADPEAGRLALDLWNQVEGAWQAWQDADDRIAQMTQHIDAFLEQAAEIARRVAPDLADEDPHDAVRTLAARLAAARAAAGEREKLSAEREKLRQAMIALTEQHAAATDAIADLHALAGTQEDAALLDAIARAHRHAALSAEIAAREAELHRLDDGKSLAELEAEAEGVDIDALPGRAAEIDARLREISQRNEAALTRLAELATGLAAMEAGRDAAGAAQEMEDALGEVEDIAARYVRLRLAHTLLRAGIDQFRRQQQGPLLARAGALFARLTEARYERLEVDEEDGKLSLVAVRPDRSHCPAERLSEGTRDQLYLALRLAAIESYAARTEPLPFIADDLLVNFDDRRARAALRVLGEMGGAMQVILFTHHAHIAEMAEPGWASLHHLPPSAALAAAAE